MSGYFPPASAPPKPADAELELVSSLQRIVRRKPPVHTCSTGWKFNGLYSGPTSVAYLFYRLALLDPKAVLNGQSYEEWCEEYLRLGSAYDDALSRRTITADNCGIATEALCRVALKTVIYKDTGHMDWLLSCRSLDLVSSSADGLLYGPAGYLYLLRMVRHGWHTESRKGSCHILKRLNDVIQEIVHRIMNPADLRLWQGREHVGPLNGSAGILAQVALSVETYDSDVDFQLSKRLLHLFSVQNFFGDCQPMTDSLDDKPVQFCTSAPGVIIALQALTRYYSTIKPGDEGVPQEVTDAIEKTQSLLLEQGLLTKTPCLRHGIPTNAYALSSDENFEEYMNCITSEELELNKDWSQDFHDSDSVGLFTGEAGRAWMWYVLNQIKKGVDRWTTGLIGFSDV